MFGIFDKKKQKQQDFLNDLKYGEEFRKSWDDARNLINEGNARKATLTRQLERITGNEGIQFPEYITVWDNFAVRPCDKSPVGYCVTKQNVQTALTKEARECLFCRNPI